MEENKRKVKEYFKKGSCFLEKGKYKEAIESFEKVIKVKPESSATHGCLGKCFRELQEYDKAIEHYKKAIQYCKPRDTAKLFYRDQLSFLLVNSRRFEEAIKNCRKIMEGSHPSKTHYKYLEICYQNLANRHKSVGGVHQQNYYERRITELKEEQIEMGF